MIRRAQVVVAALLLSLTVGSVCSAKQVGVQSPEGRIIYDPDETFGEVVDQSRRWAVLEVATGAGPEGNMATLLGFLDVPIKRLELYLGVGLEFNPARHYTASARYFPKLGNFRPYLGLGYLLNDTYAIKVHSHNAFLELGHKWIIHDTHHVTVGLGLRRVLSLTVRQDSILNDPDVDQELLREQIDDVMPRWLPTLAVRFSRAF